MKYIIFLSIGAFMAAPAFAKPSYMNQFFAFYPDAATKYGTGMKRCAICHITPMPGTNVYGQDMAKASPDGFKTFDFQALGLLDSDNDGVTNAAEISAGTLPGDK